MPTVYQCVKNAVGALKCQVLSLYYATQHNDVGWTARVLAGFTLAYALSPLDLIPDFIPILGLIDDLIILPGLIWLTIKLVPKHVWTEAQLRAQTEPLRLRHNYAAFVFVLLTWDMGLLALAYIVCKHLHIKWLQQEHNLWLLLAALSAAMVVAETVWGCMLWRAERPKPAAEAAQTDPLLLPTQSVDS